MLHGSDGARAALNLDLFLGIHAIYLEKGSKRYSTLSASKRYAALFWLLVKKERCSTLTALLALIALHFISAASANSLNSAIAYSNFFWIIRRYHLIAMPGVDSGKCCPALTALSAVYVVKRCQR